MFAGSRITICSSGTPMLCAIIAELLHMDARVIDAALHMTPSVKKPLHAPRPGATPIDGQDEPLVSHLNAVWRGVELSHTDKVGEHHGLLIKWSGVNGVLPDHGRDKLHFHIRQAYGGVTYLVATQRFDGTNVLQHMLRYIQHYYPTMGELLVAGELVSIQQALETMCEIQEEEDLEKAQAEADARKEGGEPAPEGTFPEKPQTASAAQKGAAATPKGDGSRQQGHARDHGRHQQKHATS